jgi:hypothetical protein
LFDVCVHGAAWTLAIPQVAGAAEPEAEKDFEVWLVDQSNSPLAANPPNIPERELLFEDNSEHRDAHALGVIQITAGGTDGFMKAITRISNIDGTVERADAHGIALRIVEGGDE